VQASPLSKKKLTKKNNERSDVFSRLAALISKGEQHRQAAARQGTRVLRG
jgi:hypothetical protein